MTEKINDTPSLESQNIKRKRRLIDRRGAVLGGVVTAGALASTGLIIMGHETHNNLYDDASGEVTSIELVDTPEPGFYGDNDYTVKIVTKDGKEITATCAETLCDNIKLGDTVEADLDNVTGQLTTKTIGGGLVTDRDYTVSLPE